jgi:hypothetical protein
MRRNGALYLSFLATLIFTLFPLVILAKSTSPDSESIRKELKTLRGLELKKDVPWQYIDRADLQNRYKEDLLKDKDKLKKEELFLKWMQLVPPDFDLAPFLSEYLSRSKGGLYDPKAKVVYLSREGVDGEIPENIGKFGITMNRIVSLHEMAHALQDNYFDIGTMMEMSSDDDRSYAVKSLIEGDAAYVTIDGIYKEMNSDLFNVKNLNDVIRTLFAGSPGTGKDRKTPYYFQEIMAAPYTEGFNFIKQVVKAGGWDMVNSVYRDLPDSTEQILHGEKYLVNRDFPSLVKMNRIADELAGGWKKVDENTIGELRLKIIINNFFPSLGRNIAHEGWGGDTYRIYEKDGKWLSLWFTVWDTPQDAKEFSEIYIKILKKKHSSMKIKKEIKGACLEAEASGLNLLLEVRDKSVAILENVPGELLGQVRESLWLSDVTRPEHAVKIKIDPLKVKSTTAGSSVDGSGGTSRIEINQYINTHFGFTIIKPAKWTYQPGKYNDRIPIKMGSYDTGAYVTVLVTKPTIPITEGLLDMNIKATAQASVANFQRSDSGIRKIGGQNFYFVRGAGAEKITKIKCSISVFGADVNNRVFLLIYIVPSENAAQCESDFNSVLQGMRFN